MNTIALGNITTVEDLLRDRKEVPPAFIASLRRVVDRLIHEERRNYEATPISERENHIFCDLHKLDCLLASLEPSDDNGDYPVELSHLGDVRLSTAVLKHVTYDEVQKVLLDHRLHRWGTGCDASAGETQHFERQFLHEHHGVLDSRVRVRGYHLSIETHLRTYTTVQLTDDNGVPL